MPLNEGETPLHPPLPVLMSEQKKEQKRREQRALNRFGYRDVLGGAGIVIGVQSLGFVITYLTKEAFGPDVFAKVGSIAEFCTLNIFGCIGYGIVGCLGKQSFLFRCLRLVLIAILVVLIVYVVIWFGWRQLTSDLEAICIYHAAGVICGTLFGTVHVNVQKSKSKV